MIQAFSVTMDAGVRRVRVGTAVTLIKDKGAMMRVTDGKEEFDAKRECLSNDLDLAGRVVAAEQQAFNVSAATQAAHQQQQEQTRVTTIPPPGPIDAAASTAAAQRNMAVNRLEARRNILTPQIARINATIAHYQSVPRVAGQVVRNSYGNVVAVKVGNVHDDELARLRPQVAALEAELANIEAKLAQLQNQQ